MNKKIIIILFLSIFTIQRVYALEYQNIETGYKALIEDKADLLETKEEESLLDKMIPLTNYGNIMFETTDNNSISIENYTRNRYRTIFYYKSGTSFTIDIKNRKIYIYSFGNNYRIIDNRKAYIITDNVYKYSSSEEYYQCANEAFEEIYTVLQGGKTSEPMVLITNYLIALLLSFIICFLLIIHNSNDKFPTPKDLLKKCNIRFKTENPTVIKTGTHKVYRPRGGGYSGTSFGSGGGFGGISGGSFGGGGGHDF